jgi:hypothetical protein
MQPQSTQQEWPEEHDALRAAPKHHALLFENDAVRVLDTNIAPGDTVPLRALLSERACGAGRTLRNEPSPDYLLSDTLIRKK